MGRRTHDSDVRDSARREAGAAKLFPALVKRISKLREQGLSARKIAERLNAEGWHPAKRRTTFTGAMVQELWNREGGSTRAKQRPETCPRVKDQWLLSELAAELDMPWV